MKLGAPKEVFQGESRVALTPQSALEIQKLGYECFIESGAGKLAAFSDEDYRNVGVHVVETAQELYELVDIVIKVRPPESYEYEAYKKGTTLISFLNPNENGQALEYFSQNNINAIAMEMVPRISRAQKMDALSSMANIAGYRAVIEAGNQFGRFFMGQITAAGKVSPAKVLVVGAGVAGLSAIGTSTSLGAITYAFDVRPEVAEQVTSMGAEFVFLDFEDDSQDGASTGGYAAVSSPEFREAQLAKFRELAPEIDIVITTALIPNREAPELWTGDMVAMMKPGSVIIDLAAEKGGNCKLTVMGEKVTTQNGVAIIGYTDFPSRMSAQASSMYANNIRHMLADLTPEKLGQLNQNMDDDVIRSSTVSFDGEITFPPPPLKIQAIAPRAKSATKELTTEELKEQERKAFRSQTKSQVSLLLGGTLLFLIVGAYAPQSFMSHFIVFALACFVGYQVIWKVSHSLHTPLMAVTNAISGIVILGALLQVGSSSSLISVLSAAAILIASINIVGGFLVTRRMLAMFKKS